MKKILFFLLILFAAAPAAFAHDKDGKSKAEMFKEIQEFKMKFLAQEMELKDNQQKQFFELYSEMSEKKAQAMKQARQLEKKIKKEDNPSDEDYKALSEATSKAKAETVEIENQYDKKFSEFLSQKQIFKMKAAEEEFRAKMQEMKKQKKHKSEAKRQDKKSTR